MKNKKTIKNILIGLGVAIIVLALYAFVAPRKEKNTGALSSKNGTSPLGQIQETDTGIANAKILKILGSIENIELKDDIFSNPVFRALKDKNFVITRPARIGRKNPFLPIGYDTNSFANDTTQDEISNPVVDNFISSQNDNNFFTNDDSSAAN